MATTAAVLELSHPNARVFTLHGHVLWNYGNSSQWVHYLCHDAAKTVDEAFPHFTHWYIICALRETLRSASRPEEVTLRINWSIATMLYAIGELSEQTLTEGTLTDNDNVLEIPAVPAKTFRTGEGHTVCVRIDDKEEEGGFSIFRTMPAATLR